MAQPKLAPTAAPTMKYVAIPRITDKSSSLSSSSSSSSTTVTESIRWEAVKMRKPSLSPNDPFVYAVRSTHIYCRPNCPARLARRANIEFYDSPSAAAAAGYRACKRCKPDYCDSISISTTAAVIATRQHGESGRKVAKACETIACAVLSEDHSHHRPSLRQLAAEAYLTPFHFHRVFKKVVGMTPGQYARDVAMRKKAGLVSATDEGAQETSSSSSPSYDDNVTGYYSTFDDLIDWDWDAELDLSGLSTDDQA